MKRHENYVAQQSFIIICRILKEYEGMYYRDIAAQLNVDAALFCRWFNETVKLTSYYNERLVRYFSNPSFAMYKNILVGDIIKKLQISENGSIAYFIHHMRYDALIRYLFLELTITEIEKEKHFGEMFPDIVVEAMARKKEISVSKYIDYDILDHTFEGCPDEVQQLLNQFKITSENTIVMNVDDTKNELRRIVIHFSDDDEIEKHGGEYAMKCRLMATLKAFGKIDHIIFLKLPRGEKNIKNVPEFEKTGDSAARKILKIIKKVGQR